MYESNQLGMNQLCIIRKEKNITVKSPTLSEKRPKNVIINEGNTHFKGRFCKS